MPTQQEIDESNAAMPDDDLNGEDPPVQTPEPAPENISVPITPASDVGDQGAEYVHPISNERVLATEAEYQSTLRAQGYQRLGMNDLPDPTPPAGAGAFDKRTTNDVIGSPAE